MLTTSQFPINSFHQSFLHTLQCTCRLICRIYNKSKQATKVLWHFNTYLFCVCNNKIPSLYRSLCSGKMTSFLTRHNVATGTPMSVSIALKTRDGNPVAKSTFMSHFLSASSSEAVNSFYEPLTIIVPSLHWHVILHTRVENLIPGSPPLISVFEEEQLRFFLFIHRTCGSAFCCYLFVFKQFLFCN